MSLGLGITILRSIIKTFHQGVDNFVTIGDCKYGIQLQLMLSALQETVFWNQPAAFNIHRKKVGDLCKIG